MAPCDENCTKSSDKAKRGGESATHLGHRLGALRDSVLGQLTREDEANRRLDFA